MKEMISRRSFLRVMGLGFGAAMLTACKTGPTDPPADSPAASVPDADTPVPFLTEDEFPRLDGSTACIPLMAQMKADVTGMDLLEAQTSITVSTTAYAWENFGLWSRSDSEDYGAQLLIVYEAPEYVKEELAEADAKLEQKAIGRDALVFIVNEDNPVQSLTRQQLKDIYAGTITNWKDVGGKDQEIIAFQRRGGGGRPPLPLLNATLCCGLKFFLLHGKLCLPTGQFPTGHVIGKLLLSHHQTTRRCIQMVLHRILAALLQLGQHPQKLCTVRHG